MKPTLDKPKNEIKKIKVEKKIEKPSSVSTSFQIQVSKHG